MAKLYLQANDKFGLIATTTANYFHHMSFNSTHRQWLNRVHVCVFFSLVCCKYVISWFPITTRPNQVCVLWTSKIMQKFSECPCTDAFLSIFWRVFCHQYYYLNSSTMRQKKLCNAFFPFYSLMPMKHHIHGFDCFMLGIFMGGIWLILHWGSWRRLDLFFLKDVSGTIIITHLICWIRVQKRMKTI